MVPGLQEPVEVLRDCWGIPHIYAHNADDLFFAQGFVAAQDRLFQIDLWRRLGVGETAEVLGKKGLEADRFARLLKYRGDPNAEWDAYAADAHQIAIAFTRGINAYIDSIGNRLPIEFQLLGVRPKKWQPEDERGAHSALPHEGASIRICPGRVVSKRNRVGRRAR
jgi:penicillin amidase